MRKLFYKWAFADIENSSSIKDTYFYKYPKESAKKNLTMIKYLSVFIMVISIVVIAMALTFFEQPLLAKIYVGIFAVEATFFGLAFYLVKKEKNVFASNCIASLYLLHLLIITGILATIYSPDESATVYVAVLSISQILFLLPPIQTTAIAGMTLFFVFALSSQVKNDYFFKSDILNCFAVYILSIMLGWYITKIRIEESIARRKAQELSEQLASLSVTDQLTSLHNHRDFQETYYSLFDSLKESGDRIGVIMMDIDKFKNYNDNYGHIEGDKCLQKVGKCFAGFNELKIKPFRFGGEEFVVLLTGDECDRINIIAEELRSAIENLNIPNMYSSVSNVVTISCGYFAEYPSKTSTPMEIVDGADKAMYASKKAGGNKVTG